MWAESHDGDLRNREPAEWRHCKVVFFSKKLRGSTILSFIRAPRPICTAAFGIEACLIRFIIDDECVSPRPCLA